MASDSPPKLVKLQPGKNVSKAWVITLHVRSSHIFNTMPPSHLIVVCGHAIWLGGPKNGWDEAEWLIEGYKQGETPTFIEHIKAGVRLLSQDENAVLVFSG